MRALLVLWLVGLLTGCPESSIVECGDLLCPQGSVCRHPGQCVSKDQIVACSGLDEGAMCELAGVGLGTCADEVCIGAGCGNRIIEVELGEACDDGNRQGEDGCDALCLSDETCGNGYVDELRGETCDEGAANSDAPNAGCRSNCTRARCGDGILDNMIEDCDGALTGGALCTDFEYYETTPVACGDNCRYAPAASCSQRCGDGIINGDELCEPGGARPDRTCVDLGFDRGRIDCAETCTLDMSDCGRIGWRALAVDAANTFISVAVVAPDELWAVEISRGVYHNDGGAWSLPHPGAGLKSVWAAANGDVFAVGTSQIARMTGSTWTAVPNVTGTLYDVWGAAPDVVFAVGVEIGGAGKILRFDGTTWATVPTVANLTGVTLRAVWGTAADNVYAVGTNTVLHYNGVSWQAMPALPPGIDPIDVWVSAANDLYVLSSDAVVLFDGTDWFDVRPPGPTASFAAIWGYGDDVFMTAGFDPPPPPNNPDPASPAELWHFDGRAALATWTAMEIPAADDLYAIHGTRPDNVYVVGKAATFHYEGIGWSTAVPMGAGVPISSIFGTDNTVISTNKHVTDVYATRGTKVSHFTGDVWDSPDLPPPAYTSPSPVTYLDVWADQSCVPSCQVYAVGSSDSSPTSAGFSLSPSPPSPPSYPWTAIATVGNKDVTSVWGASANQVFAGTRSGHILRFSDLTPPTAEVITLEPIEGMWGRNATDVYAVGTEIYHRDASGWTDLVNPAFALYDVWGTANAVYAVGANGEIMREVGNIWSVMPTGVALQVIDLQAIWGTSDEDIFAGGGTIGGASAVLHYDGEAWSPIRIPTSLTGVAGVWGTDRRMYIGGSEMRVLLRTAP